MTAFEDFVNTELPLRTNIAALPTAGRYARFTGVGRAVEERTAAQVLSDISAAAATHTHTESDITDLGSYTPRIATTVDNELVSFDGVTGAIQSSGITVAASKMDFGNLTGINYGVSRQIKLLGQSDELRFVFSGFGGTSDSRLELFKNDEALAVTVDSVVGITFNGYTGTPAIIPGTSQFEFDISGATEMRLLVDTIEFDQTTGDAGLGWGTKGNLDFNINGTKYAWVTNKGLACTSVTITSDPGAAKGDQLRLTNVVDTSGTNPITLGKTPLALVHKGYIKGYRGTSEVIWIPYMGT